MNLSMSLAPHIFFLFHGHWHEDPIFQVPPGCRMCAATLAIISMFQVGRMRKKRGQNTLSVELVSLYGGFPQILLSCFQIHPIGQNYNTQPPLSAAGKIVMNIEFF